MKTLRIEVSYFVEDPNTNDMVVNSIAFYRNKNKTTLATLDRHRNKQFCEALELLEKQDISTIMNLVSRDLQEQFDEAEVCGKQQ